MIKSIAKGILIGSVAAVSMVVALHVLHVASSIPDVYFSHTSDECVKVVNYAEGDNYTCYNLPAKFNHVWAR